MLTAAVRKVKRPWGSGGRWSAYVLGDDEYGLWLHCPAASKHHQMAGDVWQVPWHGVQLIPRGEWWVAWWWDHPQEGRLVTVDVCTPPRLVEGIWTYDDLELDPVDNEAGWLELVDVDEFEAAISQGWMTPDEAEAAQGAAGQIERAMRNSSEPFGRCGWRRLDEAIQLGRPPL